MSTPTFDIRIDTNNSPGTVEIEIYETVDTPNGRETNTRETLAVKRVPDRGDIPGDGDSWFDTADPAQMAQFAMLPDWVRNDALDTLALGYIALMDRGHDFNTH